MFQMVAMSPIEGGFFTWFQPDPKYQTLLNSDRESRNRTADILGTFSIQNPVLGHQNPEKTRNRDEDEGFAINWWRWGWVRFLMPMHADRDVRCGPRCATRTDTCNAEHDVQCRPRHVTWIETCDVGPRWMVRRKEQTGQCPRSRRRWAVSYWVLSCIL